MVRASVAVSLAAAVCTACGHAAQADETSDNNPARSLPPQPGDRFVYLTGPRKGTVVKAADLALGGPQVQAYPADPKSGLLRDGSRLNLVVLARFVPDAIAEETRPMSADGVVAYSGVCTHQGCPVNMWSSDQSALYCSCHGSMYDPRDGAKVVGGPAPRPLPVLGLKMDDGMPVVAESFTAHVGPSQSHG